MPERRRSRGVVAVELALCMPVLLLLVVGGVHLSRVMVTQHRLADAVDFATRAAVIGNLADQASVAAAVRARLGGEANRCAPLTVTATEVGVPAASGAPASVRALHVTASCTLAEVMGIGPARVTATVAMPR